MAIDEETLGRIEREYSAGLTSADILDLFARHSVSLSEASLRKYVQMGLVARSKRVGSKGRHKGSQGVYPVGVIRQIVRIKEMMANAYTMDQIRREVLFVRSDVEQLERTLDSIFVTLDRVAKERRSEVTTKAVVRDVAEARSAAVDLVARLVAIEERLVGRQDTRGVKAS